MRPAVRLEGVQVRAAGRLLLEVPQLTIQAGEHVAIVGPNGAGKSTLLRVIGASCPLQAGRVRLLGRVFGAPPSPVLTGREQRALRAEIGLLMQGLHLVPRLTARENVLIGALASLRGAAGWRSLLRWYPPERLAQADAALSALGLAALAGTRTDRLSGGERQKLALARLQLQSPRLILADEPTAALDPSAVARVCQALRALADAPGHSLLTVVHDPALLPHLAGRVIGMAQGRVRWDLPVADVTPERLRRLYESTEMATP